MLCPLEDNCEESVRMRGILILLFVACLLGCETADEADFHAGFPQSQAVPFQDPTPPDTLPFSFAPAEPAPAPALDTLCADFWCQEAAKLLKRGH
jgi:hypothetical protein